MWVRPRPSPTGQLDEHSQRVRRIEELIRRQMARRLHDGPTQSVSALAMRADIARRQMADPQVAEEELAKLEALARQTAAELRYMQFQLIPQSLAVAGLETAWDDLSSQLVARYGEKLETEVDKKGVKALNPEQQELVYYISAEALENSFRHAEAEKVKLSLTWPERDVVLLEVEDDGRGFDAAAALRDAVENKKFGLAILRERVKLLPGELSITSDEGVGSKLRVALLAARGRMNNEA
ncbi:MAG: hypothetical protein KIS85_07900 [Anaerolineales bacterium]|nr:hypothetical protein [Anaerolineales bacterium]